MSTLHLLGVLGAICAWMASLYYPRRTRILSRFHLLPHLRRVPPCSVHNSTLSRNGVSGKVGAIHTVPVELHFDGLDVIADAGLRFREGILLDNFQGLTGTGETLFGDHRQLECEQHRLCNHQNNRGQPEIVDSPQGTGAPVSAIAFVC